MPRLSNHGGMWPVASVTALGHVNDNSLPESIVSPFAKERQWLSRV